VLFALAGMGLFASALQAQTLEGIRDAVRDPPPASAPADNPPDSSKHEHHGEDPTGENADPDGSLWLLAFYGTAFVVTSPFWAPMAMLDDGYKRELQFPTYPYEDDMPGHMADPLVGAIDLRHSDEDADGEDDPNAADSALTLQPARLLRGWSIRVGAEYGNTFADVDRISGNLLFSTASRWGLDSEWHFLRERLPDGSHDQLALGDCNLVFRFAQSPRVEFRTGLGMNWLSDSATTNLGFNFNYAADFFPQKPWVLSTAMDVGRLGYANLFHCRTTVGLLWHFLESYVGYDHYDIGRTSTNSLIAGLRLWF
jgi:hypothetical protein